MINLLLFFALIVRLLLAKTGTLWLDMHAWISWSRRLLTVPWQTFYQAWCDYLPSYLYVLTGLGYLKNWLFSFGLQIPEQIIYKLPSIFADLATSYLIFTILKKRNKRTAFIAAGAYLFNPAVLANSTFWGQADSFFSLFLVLAFYLFQRTRYLFSSAVLAFASLLKPLGFLLVPLFSLQLFSKKKFKDLFYSALVFTGVGLLLFLPFADKNIFAFVYQRFSQTFNQYPYTSLNAFNFWGLIGKMWIEDAQTFLGISLQAWGSLLFSLIYLFFIYAFSRAESMGERSLLLALTFFAGFFFLTRMHERHLFPVFPFLLLAVGSFPRLWITYFIASLIYSLNLYYAHLYISQDYLQVFSFLTITLFSAVQLLNFLAAVMVLKIKRFFSRLVEFFKKRKPQTIFLVLLLVFSFCLRVFRLSHPQEHTFDEVYHAFTAGEMAKGNVKAWEVGHQAPEGFAYEWTHPPLAKLFMAGGIKVFGNNSFGWRFPAAVFGTGAILLVYLLAREFLDRRVAFWAAFFFAFDGLAFVMSRVGMADIYLLFFILLTVLFLFKKRFVLAGLALGFALGVKWTGLYLFPIVGLKQLISLIRNWREKENFKEVVLQASRYLFIFTFCPFLVYLLIYLPYFISGHTLKEFANLQQEMWDYHTTLEASHDFESRAYTWPFMIRPVWFWVKYQGKKIANIYNLGNPLFWWSGLIVLPLYLWNALEKLVEKHNSRFLFLVFCYLIFWVPWILSPRVMFLHHYLPALPFLGIFLAWFFNYGLKPLVGQKKKKIILSIFSFLLVVCFFYFYPVYTGILLPKDKLHFWFWFSSWR